MPPNPNDSAKVAVLRARQLLKDKRYSDALQVVTDELARGNDHPDLRLVAAHSLLAQGRHEGAKKEAQQVVRLDPVQPEAFRILADVACARGELATACEHLERVIELSPGDQRSRSLLDTLSRPSALPPPGGEDTVPIPAAMQLKVRAASLDRFIDDANDDEDLTSLPEFEISDSMMEELPGAPAGNSGLIDEISDSMMEELPLEPEEANTDELSDSMIQVVSSSGPAAPGLSTLHDPPKSNPLATGPSRPQPAAGWRPTPVDAGAGGVGQKYQGTLRLPALGELPEDEDAPTMPLLRPSAPKEPQLRLDPLAKKPVSHEPLDAGGGQGQAGVGGLGGGISAGLGGPSETRKVPRSAEVRVAGGAAPTLGGRLDDDDDDDFEDFDVEPASQPIPHREPQPIPKGGVDPRPPAAQGVSPEVDFGSSGEVDFGGSGEVDFGGSGEVDFGAESEVDFGAESGAHPAPRARAASGDDDDPMMAMLSGGASAGDDSMPAINARAAKKAKARKGKAKRTDDSFSGDVDFGDGDGDVDFGGGDPSVDPLEAELVAAGLSKPKKKGKGKLYFVLFLLLVLCAGVGVGYFMYRRHQFIKAEWGKLRAAIHVSTPSGFKLARAAAKRILEKKTNDPAARAALAVCAAATSIEFGEDRIAKAKKLLATTKGKESEWHKAARGYLMLIESPTKAAGYFRAAIETYPKSALLKYLHGRALAASGEIPQAGKAYQQALKLANGYIGARIQLAVLLGSQKRGYERGEAALSEILGKHPKNIQALIERARLGARHGKNLARAGQDANKVATTLAEKAGRGQIGWAQLVLSQVARRRGRVSEMAKALDAAIKAPPCCDSEYRYELAHELMVLFRRNDAMQQMKAALDLNGEKPSYLQRMARLLLDMHKPTAAAKYVAKAPARQIETKLLAGRLAYAKGDLKAAKAKLAVVLAERKGHIEASIYMALTQARSGKGGVAVKRLDALRLKNKGAYLLPQALGQIHLWQRSFKRADNMLRAAWGLNGLDPRTPTLLGHVSLALHEIKRADKRFRTALRRRADYAPAHIGLAQLWLAMGRPASARKQLGSVSTGDRERAAYLTTLAKVDLVQGKLDAAAGNISNAKGAGADGYALTLLGAELALLRGQAKSAVALLLKAKKKHSKDAELLVLLGRSQWKARKTDNAYDTFHAAIKVDPGHPIALLELAFIAIKDDEYNLAVRRSKQALTQIKKRGLPEAMQSRAYTALGRAYLNKKDTGRALANFQDAIRLDKSAAQPQYHQGRTYDRLDRPGQSVKFYLRAIALDPTLISAYTHAAKAYLKLKDRAKATAIVQALLKQPSASKRQKRNAEALLRAQR